jgi:hypothetical protein
VRDPVRIALRDKVTTLVDKSIQADQVRITITLKDGRRLDKFVEHVISSAQNPMPDTQLETKFLDLCDGVLPRPQAQKLLALCWNAEKLDTAAQIAKAAAA